VKSHELTLLDLVVTNCGDELSVDTTRDIETISSRVRDQGLSFLTLTLPAFGKEFERALDEGQVDTTSFPGFRKAGRIPTFLSGFLCLIFDRTSGNLLEDVSIEAIRAVRQITLMYGKIELECTPERVDKALDAYLRCEKELMTLPERIPEGTRARFREMSLLLFGDVFDRLDSDIAHMRLLPKHGPGSTADGLLANGKYYLPQWSERLENVFPYWKYGTSRPYSHSRYDDQVEFLEPGAELPVKVVFVPKTLKAPRVIAMEPTHMQYMQQAILRGFTDYVREDPFLKHMIDTKLQAPNQDLARKGSITGNLATLDLSEASDRVSNFLVEDLMAHHPHLNDGVQACRSTRASVPGRRSGGNPERGVIPLAKFASMGSALCFPMEMAVFLTVVFMAIEKAEGTTFRNKRDLMRFSGSVRIYGDDIIVPTDVTESVLFYLDLFGFVVNKSKSFWNGFFRESCGMEYYRGHDVTVTRVRRSFPTGRLDVPEMVSAVDLRNQLYKRGYWSVVRWLDDELSKLIPMPAVAETSSVLGKFSFLGYQDERTCPRLQRPMVKGVTVKYIDRRSIADGDAALMKFFLSKERESPQGLLSHLPPQIHEELDPWEKHESALPENRGKDHLLYAGRPISSKLKYGWAYSF